MLKNLFSFSRNQVVVFATLILVISIGSVYFFSYLPGNQKSLEAKQFRVLQNAERNISDKITNSLALIDNLIITYKLDSAGFNHKWLKGYIKNYSKKNFTLSIETNFTDKSNVKKNTNDKVRATVETHAGAKKDTGKASSKSLATNSNNVLTKAAANNAAVDTTTIRNVKFDQKEVDISIRLSKTRIAITYTFDQFMEPLLPGDAFDQYLVMDNSAIIYQSFECGMTQLSPDSVKTDKNGQIKEISLSGGRYKSFSQQIDIEGQSPIVIVGLLTTERYADERNKLPEKAVLLLLLIAIAGIMALPWIKLYQMGSKDRLTIADGILSLGVPMLLMPVLFFAFISYNDSFQSRQPLAQLSLKHLADNISSNFKTEIHHAYHAAKKAASVYASPANEYDKITDAVKEVNAVVIYQLDNAGAEKRTWTPKRDTTPLGKYADRDYFIKLQQKNIFTWIKIKASHFALNR